MSSRFGFGTFRDYVAKYRLKTRQKRVNLFNYLRTERSKIIERQRKKLVKRMMFWTVFLGGTYILYNQVYRKKLQIQKMNRKLQNIYAQIMEKEILKDQLNSIILKPTTIDELTNIVTLAYRYHFKIIVRMGQLPKRQKIIMCQKFANKCLFVNLTHLHHHQINPINHTLYVQTGASCSEINQILQKQGYEELFPKELVNQTVYDVIINNLPLKDGDLNSRTLSLEMLSSSGQNFRSAGETNRYGQIPSLNPLFIGTGGIFALPSAINLKLKKKSALLQGEQHLRLQTKDKNLKIDALRRLTPINDQVIEVQLSNRFNNKVQQDSLFLTCKQRNPTTKHTFNSCSSLTEAKGIPAQKLVQSSNNSQLYQMFFSINNSIFQQFLLKFGTEVSYSYKNGLLRVHLEDQQNHQKMTSIINQVTSHNGVLVWCKNQELLLRIKPSLDSSEVGAELMRKIVEVREGLDRRNVFYSHSRYQDYFAKGIFRKLTQVFW